MYLIVKMINSLQKKKKESSYHINKLTTTIFKKNALTKRYRDFMVSCGALYNQNRYYHVLFISELNKIKTLEPKVKNHVWFENIVT